MNNSNIKLGLGQIPTPQYIFVGEQNKGNDDHCLWYSLDYSRNATVIPILEPAITGFITGIRMINKPYRGDDSVKIDLSISADKKYVIRTGIETIFARGLMLALEIFDNLTTIPVTICVTPGDNDNVIYCSVYNANTDEPVKSDWDKDKKLSPIVIDIQKRLGIEPQDIKQVIEDGRVKKD